MKLLLSLWSICLVWPSCPWSMLEFLLAHICPIWKQTRFQLQDLSQIRAYFLNQLVKNLEGQLLSPFPWPCLPYCSSFFTGTDVGEQTQQQSAHLILEPKCSLLLIRGLSSLIQGGQDLIAPNVALEPLCATIMVCSASKGRNKCF